MMLRNVSVIPDRVSELRDLSKLPCCKVFDGGTIDLERADCLNCLASVQSLCALPAVDFGGVAYATGESFCGGRCLRHKRAFQIEVRWRWAVRLETVD